MLRIPRVALMVPTLLLPLAVLAHPEVIAPPPAEAQEGDSQFSLVHIYASDFDFVADRTIIPGGEVVFDMVNLSPNYKHEVFIYPTDERDSDAFRQMMDLKRTGQRADERDYIQGIVASSGEVEAGGATTFRGSLSPGFYEIGCLAREGEGSERMVHYDQGMYAAFAVR
jgi:hypothetical protein